MALMGLGFAVDRLQVTAGSQRTLLGTGAAAAGLAVAALASARYLQLRAAIERPSFQVRYRLDLVAAAAAGGGLLVLGLLVVR
jgi:uncharacterized membrane protein YidH (DUF202 family)